MVELRIKRVQYNDYEAMKRVVITCSMFISNDDDEP